MATKKNSIIAKDVKHKSDIYNYGSRARLETVCGAYALRNYGNSTKEWEHVTCPKCIKIQNDRNERKEKMDQSKFMNVFTDAATAEQKEIAEQVSQFVANARYDQVDAKAKFFIQNCKETGLTPVEAMMALSKAQRVLGSVAGFEIQACTEEEMASVMAEAVKADPTIAN